MKIEAKSVEHENLDEKMKKKVMRKKNFIQSKDFENTSMFHSKFIDY